MQTHPEEFFDESSRLHVTSKWGKLIADHQDFLEPEDKNALNDGLKKLHRQIFTEKVLEELVDPKKSSLEDIIEQYRVKGIPSVGQTLASSLMTSKAAITGATLSVGTAGKGVTINDPLSNNSLTLGSTTINESHLEHMKAHLEVLEMAKKAEVKKEVKTIFGRLFNYQ